MTSKHTPGPWQVGTLHENEYAIRVIRSINTSGQVLAHVNAAFDDLDGSNARLIAAAPELLAALETITDCDMSTVPRKHNNQLLRAVADAYELLARLEDNK